MRKRVRWWEGTRGLDASVSEASESGMSTEASAPFWGGSAGWRGEVAGGVWVRCTVGASSSWPLGNRDHRQGARSLLQAAESLRNFKQGNARMEAALQADDSGSWGRRGTTGAEEGDQLAGWSNGPGVSLDEQPGPTLWAGHGSTAGFTSQRPLN